MRDPWKYVAFPFAAIAGYVVSVTAVSTVVGDFTGLSSFLSNLLVVGVSGLISGFLVDEVIPTYLEHARSKSGGDFGGGGNGDFGGGDMDFGE